MHVKQIEINGSSNIGLYGYVNNQVALLPHTVSENTKEAVRDVLDVPIETLTVAGTSLIGAFITGNNHRLIVPDIINDYEAETLEGLDEAVKTVHTTYTCLGNNVLVNDSAALLSPAFSDEEGQHITNQLGLESVKQSLAGMETVGTLAVFNDDNMVASNDIPEDEFHFIADHFNADATPSSVNMGAAQIRCGVLCNENGFLVGKASGGPEVTTIDEGLGYL